MARYSEEQKKDLMLKLQLGTVALIIGAAIYAVGPGLPKFLDHARKNKDKPWAAKWYFNIGRLMQSTFREAEAMKVYEEFYLNWSGDESKLPLEDALMGYYGEKYEREQHHWLIPNVATRYVGRGAPPRPAWIGGEGAKPHPLMAEVMVRIIKHHEEERDYPPVRHMLRASLAAFEPGTPAYKRLEEAKIRDLGRSF